MRAPPKMLQHAAELDAFIDILKRENVRSYLEIGAKFGGTFWRVVNSLPEGSTAVAVDLPNGSVAWKESYPSLTQCAAELRARGYAVSMIFGDSTDKKVLDDVRKLGPFDAVFIDANHTRSYVAADWVNYGAMGRIVAFHDIAWKRPPEFKSYRIDVPEFWNSIKGDYRHEEFKLDPTGQDNGIGVLWR